MPFTLLVIGVVLAALVLWSMLNRPSRAPTNITQTTNAVKTSFCGDGICKNVACLSTNCPPAESSASCPQDCPPEPQNVNAESSSDAAPLNGNVNSGTPQYTIAGQTEEQSGVCPIDGANLRADDAVGIAKNSGLAQGIADLSVSYYHYSTPIDQCVWDVKNYLTRDSGKSVIIIDSTQEVFEKTSWRRGA